MLLKKEMNLMQLPLVSILLVARNEKAHLRRCLDSLAQQDYPRDRLEFLFIDGCSDDGTHALLEQGVTEMKRRGYAARLLVNEKKILASGWNMGLKEARGDYVCRIDAHSGIVPSYISTGIGCLLERGHGRVAAVGGWWKHVGTTRAGQLIASFSSCKFAVGDSPFRKRPASLCHTDTAVYGVYRRAVFSEVGYFNEKLARNQDIVMHHRLKEAGYSFLTHPDMEITYYVRSTARSLMAKAFGDGKWVALAGSEHFCLRHKVPVLFVLYLCVLLGVAAVSGLLLRSQAGQMLIFLTTLPILGYALIAAVSAIKASNSPYRLLLVPLFFVFHITYGMGTVWGYFQILLQRMAVLSLMHSRKNRGIGK